MELKVGMKVIRTKDSYAGMKVGDVGTIIGFSRGGVLIKEFGGDKNREHSIKNLKPLYWRDRWN